MHKFRRLHSKQPIQINVLGSVGKPLHATYHVRDAHFPVVDHIGKMEGRVPVVLNNYEIIEGSSYDIAV